MAQQDNDDDDKHHAVEENDDHDWSKEGSKEGSRVADETAFCGEQVTNNHNKCGGNINNLQSITVAFWFKDDIIWIDCHWNYNWKDWSHCKWKCVSNGQESKMFTYTNR